MSNNKLVVLGDIERRLAAVQSLDEAKGIRDQAEAIRTYAKATGASTVIINRAVYVKLGAERRGGELLQVQKKDQGGRPPITSPRRGPVSATPTLADLGVTKNQSATWQALAEHTEPADLATIRDATTEQHSRVLYRLARQRARTKREASRAAKGNGKVGASLYHGDILEVGLSKIPADSVDAIITDPPYGAEFLPLYDKLATLAAHALKPGGHCLVMTGQSHLPSVLERLGALRYHWTLAFVGPGVSTQVWGRKVKSNWKPILWFIKGAHAWEEVSDVVYSAEPDKRFHEWGQDVAVFAELVQRFTAPGAIILDPFCGAGTTGIAAVRLQRQFIGIDSDAAAIASTKQRLATA